MIGRLVGFCFSNPLFDDNWLKKSSPSTWMRRAASVGSLPTLSRQHVDKQHVNRHSNSNKHGDSNTHGDGVKDRGERRRKGEGEKK